MKKQRLACLLRAALARLYRLPQLCGEGENCVWNFIFGRWRVLYEV